MGLGEEMHQPQFNQSARPASCSAERLRFAVLQQAAQVDWCMLNYRGCLAHSH